MTDKKHRIRRKIVFAMADFCCAQSLDALMNHDSLLVENPDPAAARAEWTALQEAGLILPVPGYHGIYCTLAPHIRREIEAGKNLRDNEFLYGAAAVR